MHVELIELLRCPEPHEDSLLVAAASRSEHRRIVDGVLGCPVCGAEFPIENGVARFAPPPARSAPPKREAASPEVAMRIAALLELTDARGVAVLVGSWAVHASPLASLVQTPLLLVNPPADAETSGASTLICGERLPLASGHARAAALDPSAAVPMDEQMRCVRTGGRLLAPASASLPSDVREIARDDRDQVAEKTAAAGGSPRLIPLKRAR